MWLEIRVSCSICVGGESPARRRSSVCAHSGRPSNDPSKAGAALLRALLARALVDRDRILLTEYRSTDWQSLTFIGERHEMRFRIPGPGAEGIFARMTGDLTDAEFAIPKQIVADVVVYGAPARERDGSISFSIEALTIEE